MQNIALLLLCVCIGAILRWGRKVPDNAHLALNGFIINVALPALILAQIHGLHVDPALLYCVSMPWLLFLTAVAIFGGLARLLSLAPGTTGALMLTAGLGNTSFMGLPMIEAFYGRDHMALGILIDQLGTYLVLSTLGITVACVYSRGAASPATIALRVLTFPPLLALIVAGLLNHVVYPEWVSSTLARLGSTLAPLALVSVGLQLRLDALQGIRMPLTLGLTFKLIAGPVVLLLIYFGLLGWSGENMRVTLFESAMGPQIGAAVVATQYGLNPALVTMMVGVGTILAFATVPAWWHVLAGF